MADPLAERFFGYNPPFLGGQQNVLSPQRGLRLLKNDILQLILTLPGERYYRPNFGTPLRAFPFEQATDENINTLERAIFDAVDLQEDRVNVESVESFRNDDENMLTIRVTVSLNDDPLTTFFVDANIPINQVA